MWGDGRGEGRDWTELATLHGAPRMGSYHQMLEEKGAYREHDSDVLILDF